MRIGTRIQEGKNKTKKIKKSKQNFEVLDVLRGAEDFCCSLDVLYGG
jgi:hypothetical protein